ncbi:multidrug resistance protein B [Salmonella enterica subsp. enterica]|uniref:Multidrug resistance protein B n=1 Tax=Salmonella enterica I TaxID=59201 RepID=A0A447PZY9_SALET|nr:multidrug resistance protein B [Salmonella enterica subsp. enterica]
MQQQKPLEGAQLVIMTIALSLATFMQVLDSTIANVAIPTIAGNLGSSLSQGTWVITSFGVAERYLDSLNRLAGETFWRSQTVHVVDGRLCRSLLGLWRIQQPEYADLLPRGAGRGRRAADSALAKPVAE